MSTTLETISGIQARIYILPNRPPFMTAADLADAYQTSPRRLGEAVKRNPARFPERYAFRLTEVEEDHMMSQFATSYGKKRGDLRPLVFTHGGANMLASVLRGEVADRMAVAINDAFTEMEHAAIRDARFMLWKLRSDTTASKPIYNRIMSAARDDWSLDQVFEATNYTRKRLEQAVKELVAMGILERPLKGMQSGLFDHV